MAKDSENSGIFKEFERFWARRKREEPVDLSLLDYLHAPGVNKIMEISSSIVYAFNYQDLKYEFISDSSESLTGYSTEEYIKKGAEFFFQEVLHPDDRQSSMEIYKEALRYFQKIPPSKQLKTKMAFDYKIVKANGETCQLLQNSSTVQTTSKGKPLLDIGVLTDITHWKTSENNVFTIKEPDKPDKIWVYHKGEKWDKKPLTISKSEMKVLKLVAKGMKNEAIGKELCISHHTVDTHKKNMMKKTGFKKVSELVNYSVFTNIL